MTSLTRLLIAGATVAAATLGMTQAAFADPKVPADIAVPEGNKLYLKAHAVGVQIYSCNGTAWTFVAPRVDLLDRRGKLLGTHFAGPTWQAKDSSKVVAARVNGVNVDPTAIDWLLLSATSTAKARATETCSRHDVHPARQHHRRPHPARRGLQPLHERDRQGGPVHRGLPLLEGAPPLQGPVERAKARLKGRARFADYLRM